MTIRSRNLFDPAAKEPFKLSRSRLENFFKCPRCFYLDRRLGIDRPSMPGYTLNSTVDHLFKKEFDIYRIQQKPHPLMKANGVDAVPFQHQDLEKWRENFHGVQFLHQPTNLLITGAIDDAWVRPNGELIVVDYKSTSKDGEVTLEDKWKDSYKRQMDIYQWLLRQNGFRVSKTGYFVYANALKIPDQFDGRLTFDIQLIAYEGDDAWVEPLVLKAHACLRSGSLPTGAKDCEFCAYRKSIRTVEKA